MSVLHGEKRGLSMAADIEIKCIKKSNRADLHERIHGVGGVSRDDRRAAI